MGRTRGESASSLGPVPPYVDWIGPEPMEPMAGISGVSGTEGGASGETGGSTGVVRSGQGVVGGRGRWVVAGMGEDRRHEMAKDSM